MLKVRPAEPRWVERLRYVAKACVLAARRLAADLAGR